MTIFSGGFEGIRSRSLSEQGVEKAIRVGEFKVFKRVDDPSYSELRNTWGSI